jgi:hypothetical protein
VSKGMGPFGVTLEVPSWMPAEPARGKWVFRGRGISRYRFGKKKVVELYP